MISLNVKSFFTNKPVHFVIELILKIIYIHNVKIFHGLSKRRMKKMLVWYSKGTIFQFNGQLYDQNDGGSMCVTSHCTTFR